MAGSINNFISAIAANGGMSMSNGYDVDFDFSLNGELSGRLAQFNITPGIASDSGQPGALLNMFCDEAQLPSMQAATGQITGRYLGEGQVSYAHTKMRSDFTLSWMCDANMTPYKFLTTWFQYMFDSTGTEGTAATSRIPNSLEQFKQLSTGNGRGMNRTIRLKYPNQYKAKVRITKSERGKNAPNSRSSLVCLIEGVYPYSIDAVPLSYGSSQITKVSASFYYNRHTFYFADTRKFRG